MGLVLLHPHCTPGSCAESHFSLRLYVFTLLSPCIPAGELAAGFSIEAMPYGECFINSTNMCCGPDTALRGVPTKGLTV